MPYGGYMPGIPWPARLAGCIIGDPLKLPGPATGEALR